MPKIIWKGVIKSENDFPSSPLPKNAVKIKGETDIKKMQIKALPFMIPLALICIICMLAKTIAANRAVINIFSLFAGVVIGFLLLVFHELLHAAAFPKNATVYIGFMPKSLAPLALSSSPVKRNRFIFISLLPIILGIVPLIAFCLSPAELKTFNGLFFGMAVMGMVSVYPDLYNIFNILKTVPKHSILQNDKNDSYYYFENI